MSLLRHGKALALTIYLNESDRWQGQSLYVAIVHFLRDSGCAGATVMRAVAGYGAGARLHEQGGLHLSSNASLVIQVVDQPARLQRLLPHLEEMLGSGLITLHETEVLKYTHARSRGLPTKLPVRQIMETAVVTVSPDTPVATVVHLLLAAPFRTVPVVDEQHHLLGIIGTRDLVNAGVLPLRRGVVRTGLELEGLPTEMLESSLAPMQMKDVTAQEVMNRQVHTIDPESSVRQAAHRMVETGLHRLPVVSPEGTLLGMLTRADLFQLAVTSPLMESEASSATHPLGPTRLLTALPAQQQQIGAFPLLEAPTVEEHTPIAEVIDALVLSPLKRVFVVDAAHQVLGVISDVDVLARVTEEERPAWLRFLAQWTRGDKPHRLPTGALRPSGGKMHEASDLMNREVVTIEETTTVQETVERMMQTHRKVLPVVDDQHRLKGVIRRTDMLRILLEGE
jgi:CBS-domain-containing membrane protein